MDDDAFPNFGNAYTGASPSVTPSASWNPALRPDTEPEQHNKLAQIEEPEVPANNQLAAGDDDDFFDRYQEPTPRKQRPETSSAVEEATYQPESPMKTRRTKLDNEQATAAASEGLGIHPETTDDAEAPISQHDHTIQDETVSAPQDEDAAVFGPDETAEEQALGLEEHMPGVEDEANSEAVQQTEQAAVQEEAHRPEENYDYQGEETEMEKAIDESAEAPLMADEEPTPVPGTISRAPTFENQTNGFEDDLGLQNDQASPHPTQPASPPMIERSFTTNFTEPPQEDPQESAAGNAEHSQVIDQDWPAVGDDKTFADLLDDEKVSDNQHPQGPTPNEAPSTEPSSDTPSFSQTVEADWPAGSDDEAFGEMLGNKSPEKENAPSFDGAPQEEQTMDEQWPVEEDDNTFGELLGVQPSRSK